MKFSYHLTETSQGTLSITLHQHSLMLVLMSAERIYTACVVKHNYTNCVELHNYKIEEIFGHIQSGKYCLDLKQQDNHIILSIRTSEYNIISCVLQHIHKQELLTHGESKVRTGSTSNTLNETSMDTLNDQKQQVKNQIYSRQYMAFKGNLYILTKNKLVL